MKWQKWFYAKCKKSIFLLQAKRGQDGKDLVNLPKGLKRMGQATFSNIHKAL